MTTRIARIVLEALSLLLVLGTVVFLLLYWKNIPDTVPNNFNGAGEITGWVDKKLLILMPVVMAVVFVSMLFPKTVQFRSLGKSVRLPAPALLFPAMKLAMLGGFAYLTACSALVRPTGSWFLPVFFAAVFLPLLISFAILLPQVRQ